MNIFHARRWAVAATAAATLTLAACGGSTMDMGAGSSTSMTSMTSMTSPSTSMSSTSAPSTSMSMGDESSTAAGDQHNDADVMFAQMMIQHHKGAIAMAELAPTRAGSQQVKDLAETIKAAQTPEIELMTSWLTAWGEQMSMGTMDSSPTGMEMGSMTAGTSMDMGGGMSTGGSQTMSGEMTDEQMAQLEAASGTAFDTMFLEMMIVHHQGAIEMAQTETAQGVNPDALALADSITTSQTEEIATMQQLLTTL